MLQLQLRMHLGFLRFERKVVDEAIGERGRVLPFARELERRCDVSLFF